MTLPFADRTNLKISDELRALLERPLTYGSHNNLEAGYCLMERHDIFRQLRWYERSAPSSADLITVEDVDDHTDMPEDVAMVLRQFGMNLNDAVLNILAERVDLEPRLRACEPLLTDTDQASREQQRHWGEMAFEWMLHSCIPTLLRLHPNFVATADQLAQLPFTEQDAIYALLIGLVHNFDQVRTHTTIEETARRLAARVMNECGWNAAMQAVEVIDWPTATDLTRSYVAYSVRDTVYHLIAQAALAVAGDLEGFEARQKMADLLTPTIHQLQDEALSLFEQMLNEPWRTEQAAE